MRRTITPDLIDSDEALAILGMQPRNTASLRAWQRRRPLLHNTGLKPHPRGNVVRWDRRECLALRRDLDTGRKSIATSGHVTAIQQAA